MLYNKTKNLICISLVLVIIFLSAGCKININFDDKSESKNIVSIDESDNYYDVPGISYADMKYEHYNKEVITSLCDELLLLTEASDNEEKFENIYNKIYSEFEKINCMYYLSYIEYCKDTSDDYWRDEMLYNDSLYTDVYDKILTTLKKASSSDYYICLSELFGKEIADELANYTEISDEQKSFIKEESELVTKYNDAMNTDYTVSLYGEEWSFDKLDKEYDRLDYDKYLEIYYGLLKELNNEVGEIYLELVDIRTNLAKSYGYENYADYSYECEYMRDYSPKDAADFCSIVKELAPDYYELVYSSDVLYYGDYALSYMSPDTMLSAINKYSSEISELAKEAISFLVGNDLYYIDDEDNMMQSSFTCKIGYYNQPFLFSYNSGLAQGFDSIVHEFGHYLESYLNKDDNLLFDSGSYDIYEIHSTGMECLFDEYYDDIFKDNADDIRAQHISSLLSSITDGCLYDEFQQYIYTHPDMTLDDINKYFYNLSQEYGQYMYESNDESYTWMFVTHNFENPMYYISYAVSSVISLNFLTESKNDRQAAINRYMEFLTYGAVDYPLREVCKMCGLPDFTDSQYVKEAFLSAIEILEECA